MTLTTCDLGVKVDEYVTRREYHLHRVDGLSNGMKAMIIEEAGVYRAYILNVPMEGTARQHDSIEAALNELRAYEAAMNVERRPTTGSAG